MRKRNKMGWFMHYMASSYLQVSINVFTGLENQAFKYSVWEAEDFILFLRCGNRCDVSGPCGGPANGGGAQAPGASSPGACPNCRSTASTDHDVHVAVRLIKDKEDTFVDGKQCLSSMLKVQKKFKNALSGKKNKKQNRTKNKATFPARRASRGSLFAVPF